MNKFLEFGRKALFYVRVISGYEERRIRNHRLLLEKRLQQEAAIEDYLKPIDMQAELKMKMQLEGEDKRMDDMMKALQAQALHEIAEIGKNANAQVADTHQCDQEMEESATKQHAQMR